MHICAYSAIADPITVKLPIYESIESLYDHVDSFVFYDCSKYDNVDLTRYSKVRKHVRGIFNCFDDPFGAMFTSALRLVDSDVALFLDIDEIYEFKNIDLRDIIKRYPLENGAGISFALRNYYCSRNFIIDGPSSKGPTIFRNRPDIFHDMLAGMVQPLNHIRRVSRGIDVQDGVRICGDQGNPMAQYQPVSMDECVVHHTSHLDCLGKMIRSVLQFQHTSTLDLPTFFPYDMRFQQEAIEMIYEKGLEDARAGNLELYATPTPFDYQSNVLLDKFVERIGLYEFDPTNFPRINDPFTGNATL
jgi:hypothetical protein